jgi:TPR repeat protein
MNIAAVFCDAIVANVEQNLPGRNRFRQIQSMIDSQAQEEIRILGRNGIPIPGSDQELAELFRQRAEGGDLRAQSLYGLYLFCGIGVNINVAEALIQLFSASNQGDAMSRSFLQNLEAIWERQGLRTIVESEVVAELLRLVEGGTSVPRNKQEVAEMLRQRAEAGDLTAQTLYGLCLFCGFGVPRNIEASIFQMRSAALQGNGAATSFLRRFVNISRRRG